MHIGMGAVVKSLCNFANMETRQQSACSLRYLEIRGSAKAESLLSQPP